MNPNSDPLAHSQSVTLRPGADLDFLERGDTVATSPSQGETLLENEATEVAVSTTPVTIFDNLLQSYLVVEQEQLAKGKWKDLVIGSDEIVGIYERVLPEDHIDEDVVETVVGVVSSVASSALSEYKYSETKRQGGNPVLFESGEAGLKISEFGREHIAEVVFREICTVVDLDGDKAPEALIQHLSEIDQAITSLNEKVLVESFDGRNVIDEDATKRMELLVLLQSYKGMLVSFYAQIAGLDTQVSIQAGSPTKKDSPKLTQQQLETQSVLTPGSFLSRMIGEDKISQDELDTIRQELGDSGRDLLLRVVDASIQDEEAEGVDTEALEVGLMRNYKKLQQLNFIAHNSTAERLLRIVNEGVSGKALNIADTMVEGDPEALRLLADYNAGILSAESMVEQARAQLMRMAEEDKQRPESERRVSMVWGNLEITQEQQRIEADLVRKESISPEDRLSDIALSGIREQAARQARSEYGKLTRTLVDDLLDRFVNDKTNFAVNALRLAMVVGPMAVHALPDSQPDFMHGFDTDEYTPEQLEIIKELVNAIQLAEAIGDATTSLTGDGDLSQNELSFEQSVDEAPGCFTAGTQILPGLNQEGKNIEDIEIGDEVLAYDLEQGRQLTVKVLRLINKEEVGYYLITTEKTTLQVTAEHPIYLNGEDFVKAADLKTGDKFKFYNDGQLEDLEINEIKYIEGAVKVYNLEVEEPNVFFANGILVHNKLVGSFTFELPVQQREPVIEPAQVATDFTDFAGIVSDTDLTTARTMLEAGNVTPEVAVAFLQEVVLSFVTQDLQENTLTGDPLTNHLAQLTNGQIDALNGLTVDHFTQEGGVVTINSTGLSELGILENSPLHTAINSILESDNFLSNLQHAVDMNTDVEYGQYSSILMTTYPDEMLFDTTLVDMENADAGDLAYTIKVILADRSERSREQREGYTTIGSVADFRTLDSLADSTRIQEIIDTNPDQFTGNLGTDLENLFKLAGIGDDSGPGSIMEVYEAITNPIYWERHTDYISEKFTPEDTVWQNFLQDLSPEEFKERVAQAVGIIRGVLLTDNQEGLNKLGEEGDPNTGVRTGTIINATVLREHLTTNQKISSLLYELDQKLIDNSGGVEAALISLGYNGAEAHSLAAIIEHPATAIRVADAVGITNISEMPAGSDDLEQLSHEFFPNPGLRDAINALESSEETPRNLVGVVVSDLLFTHWTGNLTEEQNQKLSNLINLSQISTISIEELRDYVGGKTDSLEPNELSVLNSLMANPVLVQGIYEVLTPSSTTATEPFDWQTFTPNQDWVNAQKAVEILTTDTDADVQPTADEQAQALLKVVDILMDKYDGLSDGDKEKLNKNLNIPVLGDLFTVDTYEELINPADPNTPFIDRLVNAGLATQDSATGSYTVTNPQLAAILTPSVIANLGNIIVSPTQESAPESTGMWESEGFRSVVIQGDVWEKPITELTPEEIFSRAEQVASLAARMATYRGNSVAGEVPEWVQTFNNAGLGALTLDGEVGLKVDALSELSQNEIVNLASGLDSDVIVDSASLRAFLVENGFEQNEVEAFMTIFENPNTARLINERLPKLSDPGINQPDETPTNWSNDRPAAGTIGVIIDTSDENNAWHQTDTEPTPEKAIQRAFDVNDLLGRIGRLSDELIEGAGLVDLGVAAARGLSNYEADQLVNGSLTVELIEQNGGVEGALRSLGFEPDEAKAVATIFNNPNTAIEINNRLPVLGQVSGLVGYDPLTTHQTVQTFENALETLNDWGSVTDEVKVEVILTTADTIVDAYQEARAVLLDNDATPEAKTEAQVVVDTVNAQVNVDTLVQLLTTQSLDELRDPNNGDFMNRLVEAGLAQRDTSGNITVNSQISVLFNPTVLGILDGVIAGSPVETSFDFANHIVDMTAIEGYIANRDWNDIPLNERGTLVNEFIIALVQGETPVAGLNLGDLEQMSVKDFQSVIAVLSETFQDSNGNELTGDALKEEISRRLGNEPWVNDVVAIALNGNTADMIIDVIPGSEGTPIEWATTVAVVDPTLDGWQDEATRGSNVLGILQDIHELNATASDANASQEQRDLATGAIRTLTNNANISVPTVLGLDNDDIQAINTIDWTQVDMTKTAEVAEALMDAGLTGTEANTLAPLFVYEATARNILNDIQSAEPVVTTTVVWSNQPIVDRGDIHIVDWEKSPIEARTGQLKNLVTGLIQSGQSGVAGLNENALARMTVEDFQRVFEITGDMILNDNGSLLEPRALETRLREILGSQPWVSSVAAILAHQPTVNLIENVIPEAVGTPIDWSTTGSPVDLSSEIWQQGGSANLVARFDQVLELVELLINADQKLQTTWLNDSVLNAEEITKLFTNQEIIDTLRSGLTEELLDKHNGNVRSALEELGVGGASNDLAALFSSLTAGRILNDASPTTETP